MNIMYTLPSCPYCERAKNILKIKKIEFLEKNISESRDIAKEMIIKSGGRKTVPQIFIGDYHVGGCDDLEALIRDNKFDEILNNQT